MSRNNLYPVFLKLKEVHILIVGGGAVALEKLHFILNSSPEAKITVAAPLISPEIKERSLKYNIKLLEKVYEKSLLTGYHMVIACTDKEEVNEDVYGDCRSENILVNVADNPPLCDFYMGSVVTKGNLKIGISTNGKSPTMAKRLREFFEAVIPENIDELLLNLHVYRKRLKGDFKSKVDNLNEITSSFRK